MPKRKATLAHPTPFLNEDGLAQLVLDRLKSTAKPSAADLDLARKIIAARRKSDAEETLTDALKEALAGRLMDRMKEPKVPTNVIEVSRKFLSDMDFRLRAESASTEERDQKLEKAVRKRGTSMFDLPFPFGGPAKGTEGEH